MIYALIAIAFIATFFAFKITAIMFRLGAAIAWLSVILWIVVDEPGRTMDMSHGWVLAMFFSTFCLIIGILLMYMGRTVKDGYIVNNIRDTRDPGTKYRDDLRTRFKKYDRR